MARGISLHIGINSVDPAHYDGWSGELNACEADAEDMFTLAQSLEYEATKLLTKEASRSAVTAAIRNAGELLQPGDIFFLTYSGHGGQLPDLNGDEDDGVDETWCLYDGELVDDALYGLFCRFKPGVRIFMLSDSCHSGSVAKEVYERLAKTMADRRLFDPLSGQVVGPKFRGMPIDAARRTYLKNKKQYDKELLEADPEARAKVTASVRLISGCLDDQLSSDGVFNGVFTSRLKRVWANGKFEGNYEAFHKAIVAKMPADQTPNHFVYGAKNPEFDAQKPFQI